MRLSVLVLTHRATRTLLRRCLASLADEARGDDGIEVLVGLNGLGAAAPAERAALAAEFPWARVVELPVLSRGEARNRLAQEARAPLLHFLDDDAWVPPRFCERVLGAWARHPEAAAVGGPNVGPDDAPAFERAVDFLLRSPLGAGPMRARYRAAGAEGPRPGWTFMLTNLGARKDAFLRAGGFPGTSSAEENLLLHRLEASGGGAVFSPALAVRHRRRGGARAFLAQVFCNGRGRGEITAAEPRSLQLIALAPPLALALLPAIAAFFPRVALGALALYAGAAVVETARLAAVDGDPAAALRLPPLFPAAHIAYACGLLAGLASEVRGRAPERVRDVAAADV